MRPRKPRLRHPVIRAWRACSRQAPWGAPQSPFDGAAWIRGCAARRTGTDELWLGTFRRSAFHSGICIGGDLRNAPAAQPCQPRVGYRPVHHAAGGRTPGARFRRRDLPSQGSAARPAPGRFRWSRRVSRAEAPAVRTEAPALLSILLVFAPGVEWAEHFTTQPPRFVVRTAIDIQAPPEKVWQQVIAFSEIPPPAEWIFRAGIPYPIRAEMRGSGSDAERYCVFSTGAFVEPIQVWDEPHRLKFSVTSNPPPLEEWTPYAHIEAPHLHGFPRSEGGQFLLTPLPNGGTRLEGTTWYHHGLWPAAYWQLWSDAIIHRIHPARPQAHSGRGGEEARLKDGEAPDPLRYRPLPPPALPSQNDPHFPAFSPRYV